MAFKMRGFSPFAQKEEKKYPKSYTKEDIEIVDKLLWNWQSDLSREWYPFLMGLKLDLQIKLNVLTNDRIIKTQTNPLVNKILKIGD